MEPVTEALTLLRRQAQLEEAMRRPGGIGATEECELYELRNALQRYPGTVRAILEAAKRLRRPVELYRHATSRSDCDPPENQIVPSAIAEWAGRVLCGNPCCAAIAVIVPAGRNGAHGNWRRFSASRQLDRFGAVHFCSLRIWF